MTKPIYLDYAAATPISKEVATSMEPYLSAKFYNPSATYLAAQVVTKDIEAARASVAAQLGAKQAEIFFTAGGTEANNLALCGVAMQYKKSHIVASAIEHESILQPLKHLKKQGHSYTLVAPDEQGIVNPLSIVKAITDSTVLVSVMLVNNETGTIQPLNEIAKQLKTVREQRIESGNPLPLLLHTDACQAANYLDLHVHRLGVDLMTLNGGKIYGPKQSGALFIRAGVDIEPIIFGGGQEFGLRSGTQNVAGIVGFATALNDAQKKRATEAARLAKLQSYFISELSKMIPNAIINGSLKKRVPNNIHVTFPGQDNERLMMRLDEQGIMCAVGSACSASKDDPSHVLMALGLDETNARSSLRFTMGRSTTKSDVDYTLKTLVNCLQ